MGVLVVALLIGALVRSRRPLVVSVVVAEALVLFWVYSLWRLV